MSHLKNLQFHTPDLLQRKILDIGSGRGGFLVDVVKSGGDIIGVEVNPDYIRQSRDLAKKEGVGVRIIEGEAEKLPFGDNTFDFVNISEVIEHIESPSEMLGEVWRVLKKGGKAYLSVPSRYSYHDPHFHLYFVNWIPRFLSDAYIGVFGKHKDYFGKEAGRQSLKEMHYFTFRKIKKVLSEHGFKVVDIREEKLKSILRKKFVFWPAFFIYKIINPLYFKAFHFLIIKN